MPDKIVIQFHAIALESANNKYLSPFFASDIIWLQSMHSLAAAFQEALQKSYLDKGLYLDIAKYILAIEIHKSYICLEIVPKKDILHPKTEIGFDYFYWCHAKNDYFAYIPALGIESHGNSLENLEKNIRDNILLEFSRKKRLSDVQLIAITQIFQNLQLLSESISLDFHSLPELRKIQEHETQKLLPTVAEKMLQEQHTTFLYEKYVEQIAQIFRGKYIKSILIVAKSGVGKTALVEEFLRCKQQWNITRNFWQTTASRLIRKLSQNVGWQENLHKVCQELQQNSDVLYVKNLLELFEVGQYVGNNVSMGEYLREYIQSGKIVLLSECTEEELAHIETRSPGYSSYFYIIRIMEPSKDEVRDIVARKVQYIAQHQEVKIASETISEILQLQLRYSPYSGYPGKPIRFLESILLNYKEPEIDRRVILQHFCEDTGMPDFMVDSEIPMPLKQMNDFFSSHIFGQQHAIKVIVGILAAVKTSLMRRGKPIASLFFVGPTGVGKTEMAKTLASYMFSSRERIIRFDMSEYNDVYSVMRLTGISYLQQGVLTSAVRQQPFSVVLFDEIEKADPSFYDLLLQILGEGRLSDSQGKIVDFCSTIVIMTSNIGARNYRKGSIGFVEGNFEKQQAFEHFTREVQEYFRPELFNRLDQIIAFAPLDQPTMLSIVQREIEKVKQREGIKFRGLDLQISPQVIEYLCEVGYDPLYGARQIQRVLNEQFLIPLAIKLNDYSYDAPLDVAVQLNQHQIVIKVRALQTKSDIDQDIAKQGMSSREINELVSSYRRQCQMIESGNVYTKMMSKLDIWQRKKDKLDNNFWMQKDIAVYKKYRESHKGCSEVFKAIEDLETSTSLCCLQGEAISQRVLQDIENWEERFYQRKIELYSVVNYRDDLCIIGIYGPPKHLFDIVEIYREIIHQKGFNYTANLVWFREKYYEKALQQKKSKLYILRSLNNRISEKPEDKIVGAEIICNGPACFLYFCQEQGLHLWECSATSKIYSYVITTQNCDVSKYKTPEEIHRQKFFEDRHERRCYAPKRGFTDREYKYQDQRSDFPEVLQEILEDSFAERLEEIISS